MDQEDPVLAGQTNVDSSSAADDMAAAYESVAAEPVESTRATTTETQKPAAAAANSLQQAALGVVLQRRAVASLVFKQLWVLLCVLALILFGVTMAPWSGLEDGNIALIKARAMEEATAWAAAEGNSEVDYYYPLTFAAELKKTHAPGYTQGRGAIILFFTAWAFGATLLGIMTNRFLLMPTAAAFIMGLFAGVTRLLIFTGSSDVMDVIGRGFSDHAADGLGIASDIFGPGFIMVMIGCSFIPVYLVFSAISGAKDSKAKKGKDARGSGKGKGKGTGSGRAAKKGRR